MPEDLESEDLESLPTEELRKRAFHKAERHADLGFFWDLVKHLPAAADLEADDGSLGGLSGGIAETVELVRELLGKDLGDYEPIIRARYIEYLNEGDKQLATLFAPPGRVIARPHPSSRALSLLTGTPRLANRHFSSNVIAVTDHESALRSRCSGTPCSSGSRAGELSGWLRGRSAVG